MAESDNTIIAKASKLEPQKIEGVCYQLCQDAMSLVAVMLSKTPNPHASQIDSLLMAVQQQLVEAIFSDKTFSHDAKQQILHYHRYTMKKRLANLRGERRREDRGRRV